MDGASAELTSKRARLASNSSAVALDADQGPSASYFLIDPGELRRSAGGFHAAFPTAEVCYALKANSHPAILAALRDVGFGFEAASWFEIELLLSHDVQSGRIIFGTAVKDRGQVEQAFRAGIDRFAADSREEVFMLASAAPRSCVFIRAKLDDQHSVFRMNGKFGAPIEDVAPLLRLARDVGLVPWGVSFNVGSQATRTGDWADGVRAVAPVFHELLAEGITLEVLNLGGGFPTPYRDHPEIPLCEIAAAVRAALASLPYQPRLIVEPGRRLVATSMKLVTTVVARIERPGGPWLFLDCGVYNALYEALLHQGRTAYPVSAIGHAEGGEKLQPFVLAGPTGDGLDIIARDIPLPASLSEGDRLMFENVGAYTLPFASSFNGFAPPPVYIVGEPTSVVSELLAAQ
jgi:ornithine decarboxylase